MQECMMLLTKQAAHETRMLKASDEDVAEINSDESKTAE